MIKVHGICNVYKPKGISSHDVVNALRQTFNTRKVGHAGTLDVEAEGVLIAGINDGTKLLHFLQSHTKIYEFGVIFGVETDTLDHTGRVVHTAEVKPVEWINLDPFMGHYRQVPPAYSAIKVGGKKLYEYARNDEEIPAVPARDLTIHAVRQLTPLMLGAKEVSATFQVHASSGLYVRTLAYDIAKSIGSVAHTSYIKRLKVGHFSHLESTPLEAFTSDHLLSLNEALVDFEPVYQTASMAQDVQHGRRLVRPKTKNFIKVIDQDGRLYGVYQWDEGAYKALRILKGV